ncbi:ABC transporter ATP-binding protein [Streptomyces sp. NPDC093970]|uniref:ABC transporter ATP-binding protein n=1 Tax=Streptomyces sp. NPDC093970 TaxID=3155076 RepID=UPI003425F6A7
MIEIESLAMVFGTRTLWRDVDLTVRRGEMLALVGPSGSGKSTLLNCLGLLDRPSAGTIRYEGRDITRYGRGDARRYRRDTLGYLFQHYALIENATVAENLDVVARPRRSTPGEGEGSRWWKGKDRSGAVVAEALDRVGLAGRQKEAIHHLSGGEQQRVALARLMVQQPALVLADEPTGALDEDNTTVVMDILREMTGAGCAVVIATHDANVRDRCDAVYAVHESTLVRAPAGAPARATG